MGDGSDDDPDKASTKPPAPLTLGTREFEDAKIEAAKKKKKEEEAAAEEALSASSKKEPSSGSVAIDHPNNHDNDKLWRDICSKFKEDGKFFRDEKNENSFKYGKKISGTKNKNGFIFTTEDGSDDATNELIEFIKEAAKKTGQVVWKIEKADVDNAIKICKELREANLTVEFSPEVMGKLEDSVKGKELLEPPKAKPE